MILKQNNETFFHVNTPAILVIMQEKRRGSVPQQIGQLVIVAIWRKGC